MLTGKAGALSGVKADKLDLNDILGTVGAEFADIKQADVGLSGKRAQTRSKLA